ncbi:MAG TPA: SRPBCC family protein [Polyangiaceae bacterium]|nr:SRPBCC family protein [Polyangiaceae bacterium]
MSTQGSLKVTTPSDREVALVREFDAPRRLVWAAYTKPELMKRWAGGPPGHTLRLCQIDLRVGGRWRWEVEAPDGSVMGLGGRYLEIVPEERLVSTDEFDQPWYEGDATSTITFEEHGDRTTLTMLLRYASRQVRDFVLKTPMETGVNAGFDRLAELVAQPSLFE